MLELEAQVLGVAADVGDQMVVVDGPDAVVARPVAEILSRRLDVGVRVGSVVESRVPAVVAAG